MQGHTVQPRRLHVPQHLCKCELLEGEAVRTKDMPHRRRKKQVEVTPLQRGEMETGASESHRHLWEKRKQVFQSPVKKNWNPR